MLYYHPELKQTEAIEGMRFSEEKIKKLLAGEKFREYSKRFNDKTFSDRIVVLKEYIKHA